MHLSINILWCSRLVPPTNVNLCDLWDETACFAVEVLSRKYITSSIRLHEHTYKIPVWRERQERTPCWRNNSHQRENPTIKRQISTHKLPIETVTFSWNLLTTSTHNIHNIIILIMSHRKYSKVSAEQLIFIQTAMHSKNNNTITLWKTPLHHNGVINEPIAWYPESLIAGELGQTIATPTTSEHKETCD